MRQIGTWLFPILLLALGLALFLPGIAVLDLWDLQEMRIAEAAREMLATEEFFKLQVNFTPTWDLGPLEIWWQAIGMKSFGVGELGARLPNAVLAILALLTVFMVGQILHGAEFGFVWALLTFCPLGVQLVTRTGLSESVTGFFLFLTVACMAFASDKRPKGGSSGEAALAGIFLGLAVLSDGVASLVILGTLLLIVWLFNGGRPLMVASDIVILGLALGMTTMLWFGYEWAVNGPSFLEGFLQADHWRLGNADGRSLTFLGRIGVLLLGLFPTVFIAAPPLLRYREKDPADFRKWMVIFFWLYLVVLLLVPRMALVGMAGAAYPLGYLAALFVSQPIRKIQQHIPGLWTGIATLLFALGITSIFLPILIATKAPWLLKNLSDSGYVPVDVWTGFEGLAGILLLLLVVPIFKLGKQQKHGPASLIVSIGLMFYLALSLPFLGKGVQDMVQGGYPRLFAKVGHQKSYAAAITFKSYAPLFYAKRSVDMFCNGHADSCFLKQPVPVPVYKVVPVWSFGSGRHLEGFTEVERAGAYVLFKKKKQ